MRKCFLVLILFTLFCSHSFAAKHSFQAGKLLSVSTDERLYGGTSYRWAILKVQVGDLVYTLRGERLHAKTKDYADGLIVGDSVQVSVEDENTYLLRPDGKDMKTVILKRERMLTDQ